MSATEEPTAAGEIDRQKAGRKVWLVRVPPYVAQQWREALAASAQGLVDEDSAEAATLGHLTLEEGMPTTLRVRGPDGEEQLLYMNINRDEVATNVISYEAAPDGSIQTPRIDGVVHKRFDAAPVKLAAPGGPGAGLRQQQGAGQVDESYLSNTRKRLAAASQKEAKKRAVITLDDEREMTKLAGGSDSAPLYVKNRQAKKAQAAATVIKRRSDKMTKEELEAQLFILFGQQQHWHFTQIQKTLNQPVASVKEVLFQMADQIKRGPNKDLWELKPAFKQAAAAQAKQAAAAAAGGGGG